METGDARQSSFDAAAFRDGIEFAMQMGIPTDTDERVTFIWNAENTYDDADTRGNPYDFTSAPTSSVTAAPLITSLTVPVAVEVTDAKSASGETTMGDFDVTRLRITMLDTAYAQIEDVNLGKPDLVIVDGAEYTVDYISPPLALFTVGVYQLQCTARDES